MTPWPDGDVTARAPRNLRLSTWSVGRLATVITIKKVRVFFSFLSKNRDYKEIKEKGNLTWCPLSIWLTIVKDFS